MIKNIINRKFVNYDIFLGASYKKLYEVDKELDINVIIPVRNRFEFLDPLLKCFINTDRNDLKINFIVVEHSIRSIHYKTCLDNKINYVHIKCNEFTPFNKCLAFNVGVFLSNKSKFLMFHDLDCLVQKNFFTNLFENINQKQSRAIQSFNGRRVLYCDEQLSQRLINKTESIDNLSINYKGVSPPDQVGAPGGSIVVDYDLFFDIGGYDPELFHSYAPEDIFFWEKVLLLNNNRFDICNNPINEIYHLNHPLQRDSNPEYHTMLVTYSYFMKMDYNNKIDLLKFKADLIKKYKKI